MEYCVVLTGSQSRILGFFLCRVERITKKLFASILEMRRHEARRSIGHNLRQFVPHSSVELSLLSDQCHILFRKGGASSLEQR